MRVWPGCSLPTGLRLNKPCSARRQPGLFKFGGSLALDAKQGRSVPTPPFPASHLRRFIGLRIVGATGVTAQRRTRKTP